MFVHGVCQRWAPRAMFRYSFSCSSVALNIAVFPVCSIAVFPCRTERIMPLIELLWSCFAEVVQVT